MISWWRYSVSGQKCETELRRTILIDADCDPQST